MNEELQEALNEAARSAYKEGEIQLGHLLEDIANGRIELEGYDITGTTPVVRRKP